MRALFFPLYLYLLFISWDWYKAKRLHTQASLFAFKLGLLILILIIKSWFVIPLEKSQKMKWPNWLIESILSRHKLGTGESRSHFYFYYFSCFIIFSYENFDNSIDSERSTNLHPSSCNSLYMVKGILRETWILPLLLKDECHLKYSIKSFSYSSIQLIDKFSSRFSHLP